MKALGYRRLWFGMKGAREMKGDERLLTVLNQLLADELTAINQNMVHAEICDSWG